MKADICTEKNNSMCNDNYYVHHKTLIMQRSSYNIHVVYNICGKNFVISSTALQLVHSCNHIKEAFKILYCYNITFSFIDVNIRVQNPSTSVTEGDIAIVCIALQAVGSTNQVGSTFTVTLTTTPGKAGTYDVLYIFL